MFKCYRVIRWRGLSFLPCKAYDIKDIPVCLHRFFKSFDQIEAKAPSEIIAEATASKNKNIPRRKGGCC